MKQSAKAQAKLDRRVKAWEAGKYPSSMKYHKPGSTKKNAAAGTGGVDGKARSRAAVAARS